MEALLSDVSKRTHPELNCSLGIVTDYFGRECYVEFISGENAFYGKELSDPLNTVKIGVNEFLINYTNRFAMLS